MAGAGVVHFLGGMVVLPGAQFADQRREYEDPSGESGRHLPHASLGVILPWGGWIGFHGGSVPKALLGREGREPFVSVHPHYVTNSM